MAPIVTEENMIWHEPKTLHLTLKKKWFEMTKSGIKTEDYRDIEPYWIKRLVDKELFKYHSRETFLEWFNNQPDHVTLNHVVTKRSYNKITLGYPKSTNLDRILTLEHKGIEIREGNPEWGAEPGKLYFVIKHGKIIETKNI